jgi:AraC-like DNA-binding protein
MKLNEANTKQIVLALNGELDLNEQELLQSIRSNHPLFMALGQAGLVKHLTPTGINDPRVRGAIAQVAHKLIGVMGMEYAEWDPFLRPEKISERKMKITKSELQQLIREEVESNRSRELLEEGIMDILKSLAGGTLQNIKEGIALRIARALGFKTDSLFAKVLINFVGNLEMTDVKDMLLGDNKCLTASTELVDAMAETAIEEIPEYMGLKSDGYLTGAVRETMSKAFTENFSKKVGEAICQLDLKKIAGDFAGTAEPVTG